MKKADNFDLRKFITENRIIKEQNSNEGLITFEQLKQAVENLYSEYLDSSGETDEEGKGSYFVTATDINELIDTLDGLGFNGVEVYDFIFDAILKE